MLAFSIGPLIGTRYFCVALTGGCKKIYIDSHEQSAKLLCCKKFYSLHSCNQIFLSCHRPASEVVNV